MFPAMRLDPDVLFIDDGDVLISAGAAFGVDVCLHIVRADHGSEVANQVARKCVVPPWRDGGQAQYIEQPVPEPSENGTAPTRDWATANLHLPLTLADLAEHARVSGRTFARRFRDEVGLSPGRWIIQQRVAGARHLLESSDLSIDQIADRHAGRLRDGRIAAPTPAHRDRCLAAGLPTHLPRQHLTASRSSKFAFRAPETVALTNR